MATPTWSPSTYYATGSLVQPATTQPAVPTPIPNPSFESGSVEWALDAGLSIVNGVEHFGPGTWSLQANTGFAGERFAEMQDFIDCVPGESITARCQIQQGASSFGNTGGAVGLRFYDSLNALISDARGNEVIDGSGGAWHQSTVVASAPAGTAFVRIYIYMKRVNQNLAFWADAVEWNKISQAQSGLIFRAVQPTVGLSDSVEPVWPIVNGDQVIDNEVIWEAVLATRITWEAHAILVSGATEPTFPAQEGGTVGDNTISWRAVSRRVTDPNCPNSKIVLIAASKVFAADEDIVAYSATVNPLDWSSPNDAGYIPSNLQQYGANPVSGLGLYRSNLAVMNTQGSQLWQIDEDPAQMALLDAFPVGTKYHDAISPAFNDLFFVSSFGVRSTGIAGGSTNLQAGDAGMPIDPLVQEAIDVANANSSGFMATYLPGAGQYWLMFSEFPAPELSLSGSMPDGMVGLPLEFQYDIAGGIAPRHVSLYSGTFPDGLTLHDDGSVTGTPTTVAIYTFRLRGFDAIGTEVFLDDTVNVAGIQWWATRANATTIVFPAIIPTNFNTPQIPRGPATATSPSDYCQSSVTGTVLTLGQNNTIERITDLNTSGSITVDAVIPYTLPGAPPKRIRCIDGIFFIFNDTHIYIFSIDDGLTWQTYDDGPTLRAFNDICRLDSGRWVTACNRAATQVFVYSDLALPTAWAVAANMTVGTFDGKTIACDGQRAIILVGSNGVCYTDNGLTWTQFTAAALGDAIAHAGEAIFVGDTVVFVGQPATTPQKIQRSTDRGLTWSTVNLPNPQTFGNIRTIRYANGYTVITGVAALTPNDILLYSTDLCATLQVAPVNSPATSSENWFVSPILRQPSPPGSYWGAVYGTFYAVVKDENWTSPVIGSTSPYQMDLLESSDDVTLMAQAGVSSSVRRAGGHSSAIAAPGGTVTAPPRSITFSEGRWFCGGHDSGDGYTYSDNGAISLLSKVLRTDDMAAIPGLVYDHHSTGDIYRSVDKGDNWGTATRPFSTSAPRVVGAAGLIAFADVNAGTPRIGFSSTGLGAWTVDTCPAVPGSSAVLGITRTNVSWIMVTDNGRILYKLDAGGGWQLHPTNYADLRDVRSDGAVTYACGANGRLIKSLDGGVTWTAVPHALGSTTLRNVCPLSVP